MYLKIYKFFKINSLLLKNLETTVKKIKKFSQICFGKKFQICEKKISFNNKIIYK